MQCVPGLEPWNEDQTPVTTIEVTSHPQRDSRRLSKPNRKFL